MATLAIKGHPTIGKEVIEILEMLGGKNPMRWSGSSQRLFYFVDVKGDINAINDTSKLLCKCELYTLEGFFKEFPYKVGDEVQHKGATSCGTVYVIERMKWANNHIEYDIRPLYDYNYTGLVTLCVEDLQPYKEETMEETIKIDIPKGYEFAGVDDDKQQVVFEKIGRHYPKTYEECCKVVNASPYVELVYNVSDGQKYSYDIDNLQIYENIRRLKICRDAYWKIAGEQMGLGKPWEPDWSTEYERKYVIEVYHNKVRTNSQGYSNTILAFPTAEMRDDFLENFGYLIELCKELL